MESDPPALPSSKHDGYINQPQKNNIVHDGALRHNGVSKLKGRTGCLNCRRRRKKCDEKKPTCSKCLRHNEQCQWDTARKFRISALEAGHPSMQQARQRNIDNNRPITIIDVTFNGDSNLPTNTVSKADTSPSLPQKEVSVSCDNTNEFSIINILGNEELSNNMLDDDSTYLTQQPSMTLTTEYFSPEVEVVSNHFVTKNDSCTNWGLPDQSSLQNSETEPDARKASSNKAAILSSYTPYAEHSVDVVPSVIESPAAILGHRPSESHVSILLDDFSITDLNVLDYLTWQPGSTATYKTVTTQNQANEWGLLDRRHILPSPMSVENALLEPYDHESGYYPNDAYKELHSTFHTHLIATAIHTGHTRCASPERPDQDPLYDGCGLSTGHSISPDLQQAGQDCLDPFAKISQTPPPVNSTTNNFMITPQRQVELMQNYLEEVARWLDMFDSQRHFQLKVPLMAKTAEHLHYSILALSARQMERRDPDKPYVESLGLYQKAIELIVPELSSLDTEVIASCVLLCVLEMMSSSPRAWTRHLDGCAMVLQAAGINGVVGGMRQALFWCFARMDLWGGFLGQTLTKIPTNYWFTFGESMSTVINRFRAAAGDSDSRANYAAFLCASVINVISDRHTTLGNQNKDGDKTVTPYATRWKALFDLLEDWYNGRPEEMQPLFTHQDSANSSEQPFPIILYPSDPAVSGNQMYHAAAILLLQERPREHNLQKSKKSILWHARQICGISLSNVQHGPWVNAVQPLWIAGKLMSHKTEHEAIIKLLAQIEKDTGWSTAWRAQDLLDHWGET